MLDDDYQKMCSIENLKRSYRWIQSNSDYYYKSFFRDSYAAYASASQYNLRRIRRMLLNGSYEATHAAKIYLPKPSGILRPYTLLTVNDQIVYQACVNLVADRLKPRVKGRYEKMVFGHLYAGKSSSFFYLRWQRGYQKFSKNVFDNFEKGYVYVANFDLASFYDSIDHNVLKHFLEQLDIDKDLIIFLLACLKKWTSCTWTNIENPIYHEHGIPQGPLSSGLLSEVVLSHLDEKGGKGKNTKYLRYVDDIKIFAKNESLLRQRLISLDLASKEIGLFPQSAKVNIRKITDPTKEVKSISNPPERSIFPAIDQEKLIKRILELSKRNTVNDDNITRFKYLLSQAHPTHKLNKRLIQLLPHKPSLSPRITAYFEKYEKLPKKAAESILQYLKGEEIYHSVHADLLMACIDNMTSPYREKCADHCHNRLFNRPNYLPYLPQPSYKSALMAWLIVHKRLDYNELSTLFFDEKDWWVQKDLLKHIGINQYGAPSYQELLNKIIKNPLSPDSARGASMLVIQHNLDITLQHNEISQASLPTLFVGKKIKKMGKIPSLMNSVLPYVLKTSLPTFDWQKFFGTKHDHAEQMAFTIKGSYEANINNCIVTLDSFCDLTFEIIFNTLEPNKTYGNYGGMLDCKEIKKKLPITSEAFKALHEVRKNSHTAHPRIKKSSKTTTRLKHHDLYKVRPNLGKSFDEIINFFR